MGKTKHRIACALISACLALAGLLAVAPVKALADTASDSQNAMNEKLIVRYAMDDTSTGNGAKIKAQKWDSASQSFVDDSSADATISNGVQNKTSGAVTSVSSGADGSALKFTESAHARANFRLPSNATGMTVSMWVKDINSYWSSLIEFWDGTNGGRFGKGTMQKNGGRQNEGDAYVWPSNCPAHTAATIAEGGGWDSFVINVNSTDNGGAAVDPMVADKWYQVTYVLTASEMKAYRNGELKQTFDKGYAPEILQSIMTAAKSNNGKLGIRLSLDTNSGDILDDLRIYSYAMSGVEIKNSYDLISKLIDASPEYYDVSGLGYPAELLFDGATSVSDGANGTKTGVTKEGVSYSYTPLTIAATPQNDENGIQVTFTHNGIERVATVKFRRTLILEAQSLGYKIGSGASVPIDVPQSTGEDIIVKVAAETDLSNVTAGDIAVKLFAGDSDESHYTKQFSYSAISQTATVRFSYTPYAGSETIYTIKFVKKSTETLNAVRVTSGKYQLSLTKADFTANSASVTVSNLNDFTITVSAELAFGATLAGGGSTKTFTQSDLAGGKLTLTVINENGGSTDYYLVPVECSDNATLSALAAGSYALSPTFAADITEYTVTVDEGETSSVLSAVTFTAAHANATADKRYNHNEGAVVVLVTAEDGTVQRYVIRVHERDTDATLSEIKVGDTTVAVDPDKSEFTVKYAGTPDIIATTTSPTAGTPSVSDVEDGKVIITVTAESGAQKQYTVTLVKMSSDATLKKLTLGGTEITFDGDSARYTSSVGLQLLLNAATAETAEGATASYGVSEAESKLFVTVTAEDGTERVYTVIVSEQPYTAQGETEDNSPEPSGCASSVSGTAIVIAALALSAGIWLFVKKERKTR